MGRDSSDGVPERRSATAVPTDGRSSPDEITAFLAATSTEARHAARGRLIFALDATASRQPTWDRAAKLQAAMFREAARIGGLEVQLVYYRGGGECRASRWLADATALGDLMGGLRCRAGPTEIGRVLTHVAAEARRRPVAALAFVGDACEESADELRAAAAEVALAGVACFLFQEGDDPVAAAIFADVARLTRGAHVPFDAGAADRLAELLAAVAAYAAGGTAGLRALADRPDGAEARRLIGKMAT
ncbi:VWA domain-containing protein [Siculibacillus lacustris]|uniref:VWA domain-containing protein n=1 Tax=Siculibacillus lacustris TaxID=1549641 RepID=A0A4Q9VIB1_9HYPH|nr:VWA domain-containing protein [Siculibacillus lacustris]TBW34044.1 VWA domain-containing protein [Siculibacillus lacustris]